MFKKVAGIFLVCTFTVLLIGAAVPGSLPVFAQDDEVLDLSLEKAIAIAMEKNTEVNLARLGVDKAEKGLDEAKRTASKSKKGDLVGVVGYNKALIERVAPEQAEMQLTVAEKALTASENAIKLAVEKAYYDVLKAQRELENAEDALKRAEERLRLAKVSFEAGNVAQLEVINAEVALAQQQVRVSAASNNYKSQIMEFNKTVGLELDARINLTTSFSFESIEVDLEQEISEAKETDVSYTAAREGLAVAEKNLEVAKSFYTPNVYTYKDALYEYEEAKLNAEQTEKDLIIAIHNAYFNLLSAQEQYEYMKKAVEQAQEAYRLTKLRTEVGMSTQIELQEASDMLDESQAKLLEALYTYNLAAAQFKYNLFSTTSASSGMMAGEM